MHALAFFSTVIAISELISHATFETVLLSCQLVPPKRSKLNAPLELISSLAGCTWCLAPCFLWRFRFAIKLLCHKQRCIPC